MRKIFINRLAKDIVTRLAKDIVTRLAKDIVTRLAKDIVTRLAKDIYQSLVSVLRNIIQQTCEDIHSTDMRKYSFNPTSQRMQNIETIN